MRGISVSVLSRRRKRKAGERPVEQGFFRLQRHYWTLIPALFTISQAAGCFFRSGGVFSRWINLKSYINITQSVDFQVVFHFICFNKWFPGFYTDSTITP
jgi:hypothetical protein